MRRRKFLCTIGGAVTWPIVARGQPTIPRVGYIWIGDPGTDQSGAGLRKGLADHGYEIGRTLVLEERYAYSDTEKVPELIAELLALKVDVLVTVGTFATLAARRATSTVPIVCASGDPVKAGLAASLKRPGGNVTGVTILSTEYSAKWLELMKEAVPNLHRVAVLWNPENSGVATEVEQSRAAARILGVDLSKFDGRPKGIDPSFASIAGGAFDGLVVTTDPSLEPRTARIIAFAAERRLPTIYPFSTSVQQGGLMSYSIDLFEIWRRAASHVDRILKGANPADLPIEQPRQVALKINLRTAKSLGIPVPATLLARADELVE